MFEWAMSMEQERQEEPVGAGRQSVSQLREGTPNPPSKHLQRYGGEPDGSVLPVGPGWLRAPLMIWSGRGPGNRHPSCSR